MEVNPGFAWKLEKTRHNSPPLPDSIRGLIVGSSNYGKTTLILNLLLNPGWLDYNHLYVFGISLHQKEYQVLRKGFEAGLSKEQLANLFKNQELIKSPIEDINEYIASGGEAKGGIQEEFLDDCKLNPDPSAPIVVKTFLNGSFQVPHKIPEPSDTVGLVVGSLATSLFLSRRKSKPSSDNC